MLCGVAVGQVAVVGEVWEEVRGSRSRRWALDWCMCSFVSVVDELVVYWAYTAGC